ncbi:MAG: glycosyltransferase [Burkholderiales bacterium]|jgi:glycosyltransferase involved in cell wall biosynthesis|nr:glycosyltransferase [Burkholderiales bacterium]
MISISVVTAVYNGRETVVEALESVLAQDHPCVETVIVDGGSTDGTLDVLSPYRSRVSTLVSEPDNGIYDALNKGIRLSSGDVIGFLHADDLFANAHVLSKVAAVFADPTVDAVYGDLVYVRKGDIGRIVRQWHAGACSRAALRSGWMPPHPTFYVRRSIYDRLGGFDTRYRIAADYDSILRLLFVGGIKAAYVPETLVRMRVGGVSNRSLENIIRKSKEDYRIVRAHRVGGVLTVLQKNVQKMSQFWRRTRQSLR